MSATEKMKDLIERKTGLSLADSLNVAMFLLTIWSLIVAILGVGIAIWSYESADRGARDTLDAMRRQQAALDDASASLRNEAVTLKAANAALSNLLEQSKAQLAASRGQLASSTSLVHEMNRGLKMSKEQLDLLNKDFEHRKELENRHPDLEGQVSCSMSNAPPQGSYVPLFAGQDRTLPILHLERKFRSDEGHWVYTCRVLLINKGTVPVDDGFMHISWNQEQKDEAAFQIDSIGARIPNYDTYDEPFRDDTPWHLGGLILLEKARLYTVETYGRPNSYRFQIRVPDDVYAFKLNYHLVGSNYARHDGSVLVDLDPLPVE